MKKIILLFVLSISLAFADGFFALRGGTTFPHTLSNQEAADRATLNLGVEWGGMINNVVGIGGVFDMNFKNTLEEIRSSRDSSTVGGVFETYYDGIGVRRRQFSAGIGMWFNPLDDMVVRPILRANFMPSMMILINDFDTDENEEVLPPSGAYWGYVAEAGGDVHFMITEKVSVFAGGAYRFGSVRKRIYNDEWNWSEDQEYEYLRQPMQGLALRAGFMFW